MKWRSDGLLEYKVQIPEGRMPSRKTAPQQEGFNMTKILVSSQLANKAQRISYGHDDDMLFFRIYSHMPRRGQSGAPAQRTNA
jgi:hypothetical protein